MSYHTPVLLVLTILFILGMGVVGAFILIILLACLNLLLERCLGDGKDDPTFPHGPCL